MASNGLPEVAIHQNGINHAQFCPAFSVFKGPDGTPYTDKYSDASATWVISASILIFFMKTGFLFIEVAFVSDNHLATRRVILAKYLDTCASAIGFYFFGYAVSGGAGKTTAVLGEENDFIEWFFRFTFASNTATILHGTLVGETRKLRMIALFIYAFLISAFIHPFIARLFWSPVGSFSPYRYCNGTLDRDNASFTFIDKYPGPNDDIVFFDFAGSGAVHMLGGFGGLILALICKFDLRRNDKKRIKVQERKEGQYSVSDTFTTTVNNQRGNSKRSSKRSRRQSSKRSEGAAAGTSIQAADGERDSSNPGPNVAYLPADEVTGERAVSVSMRLNPPSSSVGQLNEDEEEDFLDWMYPKDSSGEHMEFAALGVLILWMTFFAFNCGTTESVSGKVHHAILGRIALNMVVSGCFGGIFGIVIALFAQLRTRSKYINTNEIANCILSSLVAITGVCPYIDSPRAIVVGIGATLFYHLGAHAEYRWDIRDTARVFPVHGMCGMWGLICVGILGQPNLIRQTYENLCQCLTIKLPDTIDSPSNLFLYQLAAIGVIVAWSVGSCGFVFIILRIIKMQGFANFIQVVFVDFSDRFLTPVLTVLIACKKPRKRPPRPALTAQTLENGSDGHGQEGGVSHRQELSLEERFIFEGGMLLTGETEYGTGLEDV